VPFDGHDLSSGELARQPHRCFFYPYGCRFMADTLCHWQRELQQMQAIRGTGAIAPPACLL
jgi:hypothetical protein